MEKNLMRSVSRSFSLISILTLTLTIMVIGCGGDNGGSKPVIPDTAAEFTERGWGRFEAGDLDGALSDFNAALALDAGYGPAYLGQGWSRLSLAASTASMEPAAAGFDSAFVHGQTGADCLSGRAAAHLGVGGNEGYLSAVSDALSALQLSPSFTFAHRNSFNSTDVRLIIAFAHAGRNQFPDALAAADEVSDSGITEVDPETWVVGGETYKSFQAAVLAHLQALSDRHSG
jgi:hypothetical protein